MLTTVTPAQRLVAADSRRVSRSQQRAEPGGAVSICSCNGDLPAFQQDLMHARSFPMRPDLPFGESGHR